MKLSSYLLIFCVLFGVYYMYNTVKRSDPPPSNGNTGRKKPSIPKDINIYLVSLDNAAMVDWYENLDESDKK